MFQASHLKFLYLAISRCRYIDSMRDAAGIQLISKAPIVYISHSLGRTCYQDLEKADNRMMQTLVCTLMRCALNGLVKPLPAKCQQRESI